MIKYAFMKVGVPQSNFSRLAFFNNVKFIVGEYTYSFQDWENGILRANKKAPYAIGKQFSKTDPRLALMVKNPDARIHFGLNCGARSCPPVRNFTVENLKEELRVVSISFCEDAANVRIYQEKKELHLSPIFSWYRIDYAEKKSELPKVAVGYLRGTKKQSLERMLDRDSVKVCWLDYDWSTNSSAQNVFEMESMKANKSAGLKNLLKRPERSIEVCPATCT